LDLMTTELQFLATSVLGLLSLIATSHLISFQRGYRWSASERDEPMPPLRGLANRVDQATTNFLGRVCKSCLMDNAPTCR
jgi:uncharacterized MAPEG superfamily protein